MFLQLRPGYSYVLCIGSYKLSMEELYFIFGLYDYEKISLWEIQDCEEFHLHEAQIEEIACAISHVKMELEGIPLDQRPRFTFDPSSIDLDEFRVGNSRQLDQVSD